MRSDRTAQDIKLERETENVVRLEAKLKEAEIAVIQSNRPKRNIMVIGEEDEEDQESFSSSNEEIDEPSTPSLKDVLPRLSTLSNGSESQSAATLFFSPQVEQPARKFEFSEFSNTCEIET